MQYTQDFRVQSLPALVHGLKGIMWLFGVCKKTAHTYKQTWLKPACKQVGKTIVVNVEQALELYEQLAIEEERQRNGGELGIIDASRGRG
jgi:hypothetical protein